MTATAPVEPTSHEELLNELGDAYQLIRHAVPLALRLIQRGDVTLAEQRWFWYAVEQLDKHVDVLNNARADFPLDDGPRGIDARRNELLVLLRNRLK